MYFDVKPEGCRENVRKDFENEDEEGRRRQRRPNMNPALVVTNDWNDANVYHVFAVTEEALCEALANEPRYLGIATGHSEGGFVGEEGSEQEEAVAAGVGSVSGGGGGGVGGENDDDDDTRYATMLTVVAYGFRARARWKPKVRRKEDGCRDHLRRMLQRSATRNHRLPRATQTYAKRKGNLASQSPFIIIQRRRRRNKRRDKYHKIIRLRGSLRPFGPPFRRD